MEKARQAVELGDGATGEVLYDACSGGFVAAVRVVLDKADRDGAGIT